MSVNSKALSDILSEIGDFYDLRVRKLATNTVDFNKLLFNASYKEGK